MLTVVNLEILPDLVLMAGPIRNKLVYVHTVYDYI